MRIEIPEFCLVMLVGVSGSGKSTFAARHFKPTEVLGSDFFRGMVCDDENSQSASADAFSCMFHIAEKRLKRGLLTVMDATHLQQYARKKVMDLAREQNCFAVAIALDLPLALCQERVQQREYRQYGPNIIARQFRDMRQTVRQLRKSGFRYTHILQTPEEIAEVEIVRTRLWNNKKDDHGPFDIIGDVHGCYGELCALLRKLGYTVDADACTAFPPDSGNGRRKAIFLGDFCDRGPQNVKVLRLAMNMVNAGHAHAVLGNHDAKLASYLDGRNVSVAHGLENTIAELESVSAEEKADIRTFLQKRISHYILDDGRLAVAHAGIKESLQGKTSNVVRTFCLYGDITGEKDEYGLPVRLNWAEGYEGKALVVYGHTPCVNPLVCNNTMNIDTGCVFGGKLTALRYPENQLVDVPAEREYYAPVRPMSDDIAEDSLSDIGTLLGRRYMATRFAPNIIIPEQNSAAALEIMSRFAIDPHWLIYLPPTMAPTAVSPLDDFLEYPPEAFAYYQKMGVRECICEEKHMGSRGIIVLCRDVQTAQKRFLPESDVPGIIYTRTGRRFFDDPAIETAILEKLGANLDRTGFWDTFKTDWLCLDCEIMPWSAKGQELIRWRYAPAGNAGCNSLRQVTAALRKSAGLITESTEGEKSISIQGLVEQYQHRLGSLEAYNASWRHYAWPVEGISGLKIAPFHILATDGHVWCDQSHQTHLDTIANHVLDGELFVPTRTLQVATGDAKAIDKACDWWRELTATGGEGMVVKPMEFIPVRDNAFVQPALKCRGKEYLRIIYGPEYTDQIHRLKRRSGGKKAKLAQQEFALGIEGLERFTRGDSLRRVHECVFSILALESEPVDPRL